MTIRFLLSTCLLPCLLSAQTSYFTGDTTDVTTPVEGGVVLMGGATENDNAMRWFLQHSGGGDIVVIRASGSDGYNDYLFSELGVPVNSVETILMTTAASAQAPWVADHIRKAEALWIAGGDQSRYVSFWKDQQVEDALRYLIHDKKVTVGGTSAGMAILGDAYYSAFNSSATSAQALANPYHVNVTLGYHDFLDIPILKDVITDTHFDSPDRRGRTLSFLGRIVKEYGIRAKSIASEEYTAVCVDTAGIARVFGTYPQSQDFAYFIQTNCIAPNAPEVCTAGEALTWNRNGKAVLVYKVPATNQGTNTFDLNTWIDGTGGTWEAWSSILGGFTTIPASVPDCTTAVNDVVQANSQFQIMPNPATDQVTITIDTALLPAQIEILDIQGKKLIIKQLVQVKTILSVKELPVGVFSVRLKTPHGYISEKLIKGK